MTHTAGDVGEEHWGTQTRFRARRLERFVRIVDAVLAEKGRANVLDMGGNAEYWLDLEEVWRGRPITFTLVNIHPERVRDGRFTALVGDCRALPDFADGTFDVVHSNSVIEHVGRWRDMAAFAGEVRRLAPRYYVQTPNFWFPIEPHFRVPGFQFLPEQLRVAIVRRFACGAFPKAASVEEAHRFVEDSILLDAAAMRTLFPDAVLERERFFGLAKSLIAVR